MQRRRDLLGLRQLALEIAPHLVRKARILDSQHHLEIEIQAAEIEIGRADMHHVAHHDELGVKFFGQIFEHPHAVAQQAAIGVARGRDGGIIVRPRGGEDPHLAPVAQPPKPAKHRERRREIGGDHVEAVGLGQIASEADGPRMAVPHRPRILPAKRSLGLRMAEKQAAQGAQPRLGAGGPAMEGVEIARRRPHRRSVQLQPQVAPARLGLVAHIIDGDVRASGQRDAIVDHHQFLVIAQEIADAEARVEQAARSARLLKRVEKPARHVRPEAVDDDRDPAAPADGADQGVAYRLARRVAVEHVEQQANRRFRAVDHGQQGAQSLPPAFEQGQAGPGDVGGDRRGRMGICGDLWGHGRGPSRAGEERKHRTI